MKKVDAVCGEMESGRPYSVGLTMICRRVGCFLFNRFGMSLPFGRAATTPTSYLHAPCPAQAYLFWRQECGCPIGGSFYVSSLSNMA
jgi:hypothetical protein